MKVNKSITLLVILTLTMSILVGCTNKKQAPEGVTQEFYDDILESLEKLEKYKSDDTKNGYDVVEDYYNSKVWLKTTKEDEIIEAVKEMYLWVWLYYEGNDPNIHIIKSTINDVAEILEIEIDINKYLVEK